MNVSTALQGTLEKSIIELVVRKGLPVLPNGELRQNLVEAGFTSSAWQDQHTNKHVAGGYHYDDWQRKWVTIDGCNWVSDNAYISREDIIDDNGHPEIILEVSGLMCSCGQHYDKTLRYKGLKDEVLGEITRSMARSV